MQKESIERKINYMSSVRQFNLNHENKFKQYHWITAIIIDPQITEVTIVLETFAHTHRHSSFYYSPTQPI
jgi:hypothetical protein